MTIRGLSTSDVRKITVYTVLIILLLSDLPPIINVSTDQKVLNNINKFRDLLEALPAGVITVGSFFHPHLCGSPKLPFILPVREVLKSKYFPLCFYNDFYIYNITGNIPQV